MAVKDQKCFLNDVSHEDTIRFQREINLLRNKGVFTEIHRESFKDIIYSNGLSTNAVARIFGVTTTTIRKWLNGTTKRLPISARKKMASFLSGQCSTEISCYTAKQENVAESLDLYDVPPQLLYLMERLRRMYDVITQVNGLEKTFLKKLDEAMKRVLAELLPSIVEDLKYHSDRSK